MSAKSADLGLLDALRNAVEPARKDIASLVWPDSSERDSRLSRVFSGELSIPPALLRLALQGPNPAPLLRWFARVARVEVTPLREPAAALREKVLLELVHVREQLSLAFDALGEADRIEAEDRERAPMRAVRPSDAARRGGRGA